MGSKSAPRLIAFLIRADVFKLSTYRRSNGEILDQTVWWTVIAAVFNRATRGRCRIGNSVRTYPGLDALTLVDDGRRHGFKRPSEDEITRLIDEARNRKHKIGPAAIGRLLKLTAEERRDLCLRNIFAFDETSAERKKAAKQRKIERDGGRWKTPRAQCLSRTKPWEKEGICRRTWENRRRELK